MMYASKGGVTINMNDLSNKEIGLLFKAFNDLYKKMNK